MDFDTRGVFCPVPIAFCMDFCIGFDNYNREKKIEILEDAVSRMTLDDSVVLRITGFNQL